MNIQKNGTSIFAVIAFISYFTSVVINLSSISNNINSMIDNTLPLSGLNVFIFGFLMIIGVRLYLHGWMIDETFLIDRIMHQNNNNYLKIIELIIRFIWLSLTAFLPYFLKGKTINLSGIDISWDLYLTMLFGFLLIWGVILKRRILEQAVVGYSNGKVEEIQKNLKKFLFRQDWIFFGIFLVNLFIWNTPSGTIDKGILNYRVIFFVPAVFYVAIYSVIQIIIFYSDMRKSKIEITFSRN